MLQKIVYAGSNNPAFRRGSQDLLVLAEVTVDAKQVERLTQHIGHERQHERDAAVAAYLARPLAQREEPPPDSAVVQLAVVEMDGGRWQIRGAADGPDTTVAGVTTRATASPATLPAPGGGRADAAPATEPAGDGDRPARSQHWREDKVGCLLTMTSAVSVVDPCPEIPAVFVDPLLALKLRRRSAMPPSRPAPLSSTPSLRGRVPPRSSAASGPVGPTWPVAVSWPHVRT